MKQITQKEIYRKHFRGNDYDVRFSDLPKDIQENDIIEIIREDSYYSENNSYEAYTELVVLREVEETDEEYQERLNENARFEQQNRKKKYEYFLKLKAEFEQFP